MSFDGRYALGDKVRIVDLHKAGHVRTPAYVRDKPGIIDHDCGDYENPEERAYGRVGRPRIPLYRVRVKQSDIWGDSYVGPPQDTLVLEIYHHWLRPEEPAAASGASTEQGASA